MKKNFKCNKGHKFYVAEYSTVFQRGECRYKDKYGIYLYCSICNSNQIIYIAKKEGVPELLGASHGTFPTEQELLKRKQDFTKLRSRHHFKNEVLPTHPDPHLKKHFQKKYKGTAFKDHEKMHL